MREAIERGRAEVPAGSRLGLGQQAGNGRRDLLLRTLVLHGVDTYEYGFYPGNYGVYVDRYSGHARQYFPNPANDTVSNNFMQNWMGRSHMGTWSAGSRGSAGSSSG